MAGKTPVLTGYQVNEVDSASFKPAGFQRKEKESRVSRIAAGFTWELFKPITIAQNGTMWVIDGQHTFKAMQRIQRTDPVKAAILGIDLKKVPTRIIPVKTYAEAADWYVRLNGERWALSPFETYEGELAAKKPVALLVDATTKKYGLVIGEKQGIEHIAAVSAAKKLATGKSPVIDQTLGLITSAWPYVSGDPVLSTLKPRTEAAFLAGVGNYVLKYRAAMSKDPDVSAFVGQVGSRQVVIDTSGGRLSYDVQPLSLTMLAQYIHAEAVARGIASPLFGKDLGAWVADAIGRTVHTKKVWQHTFGGR